MSQILTAIIDTQKASYRSIGQVNAADDLELELEVKMNGKPIEFINPQAELLIKKSDNNRIRQIKDILYQDGKFKIKVDEQGVTYPGIVTNQLVINDEGRVSTCLFYFIVGTSLDREILQSIDKVEVLEQLDEYVLQAFENLREFEERIEAGDATIRKLNDDMIAAETNRENAEADRGSTFDNLVTRMNNVINVAITTDETLNNNETARINNFNTLKTELEQIREGLLNLNNSISLDEQNRVQAELDRANASIETINRLNTINTNITNEEATRVQEWNNIKSENTTLKEALTTINNTANSNEEVRKKKEEERIAAEQQRQANFETMQQENNSFKERIDAQYETIASEFDKAVANVTNGNENVTNSEIVQARGKEVNLNARLTKFDSQLETKAEQTDLEIQKARIDTFTTLSQGSTTGDAELIDGRVGADGIIYNNIGDANRTQFKKINDNVFKETRLLTNATWVLKHIDSTGDIVTNSNKNVVTEQRNLLNKGTNITVDDINYKFQIALYNKSTNGFIQRISWMQYGTVYQLDNDYLVRIEVSDKNESVQSDTSISSHVKVFVTQSIIEENANNIQLNADKIEENKNSIQNINIGITNEISNLVDIIGVDMFKRKEISITKEEKYNAWSMISIANNKLVCLYTRVNNHEDYSGSVICAKTSSNGVVWSKEKILLTNGKTRSSVTGKGKLNDNALFWIRTNGSPTKYELYSLDIDGTFTKISTPSFNFDYGHIGDIINVPTVGLLSFYNTYATNRTWGVIVSRDNGVTWEQIYEAECSSNSECPTEISGVYIQDGKILAIGRKDIWGGTYAQFQIQSSDFGQTWSINYTNITDISMSTASLIYNSETNEVSNYYFDRGTGMKVRKNNINVVWNNPLNWANSERLVDSCGNIEDEGNVNAIELNGNHMVTYYKGNSTNTGIYEIII